MVFTSTHSPWRITRIACENFRETYYEYISRHSVSSLSMPPSMPALVKQPLPDGGILELKAIKNKGTTQLKVYRTGFKPVWLYRDANDRIGELLEAHGYLRESDVGETFQAMLINGAWLRYIHFGRPKP